MANTRLTFVLDGRDELSRIFGGAGRAAERFQRSVTESADGSNAAILTLTRDSNGRLRDMQGRYVAAGDAARLMAARVAGTAGPLGQAQDALADNQSALADWSEAADRGREAGDRLGGALMSLAPAAVPFAASLAPMATGAGAVAVALAAVAAAAIPQIGAIGEAAEAQKTYESAVKDSGASSRAALTAEAEYQRVLEDMPPATREAAAAMSVLKEEHKEWSDGLASATMEPFTKGIALTNELLPATTGLVRGSSAELDRLMTIAGGAMAMPGFDRFADRTESFAVGTLRGINDELIELMRTGEGGGELGGTAVAFMDYAREQGPAVRETLGHVAEAVINILEGAADAGPGLLAVVSAVAGLVAAIPPEFVTVLLGVYTGLKMIGLGRAGVDAVAAASAQATAQVTTMGAAAQGASGRVAGMGAAMGTLSSGARTNIAIGLIGGLALGINYLADEARGAPPEVDKLTMSLKELSASGKWTGELAATYGDMDGFVARMAQLRMESQQMEDAEPFLAFSGLGAFADDAVGKLDDLVRRTESFKAKTEELESFDKAFASMAQGGYADQAAEQYRSMARALEGIGMSASDVKDAFPEYNAALAGARYEQQLAAEAQGIFGAQAQKTKEKLAAQRQSVDGLRQSIQALNDINRAAAGAQSAFEQAIDDTATAAGASRNALSMSGGQLDLNSQKARDAEAALRDLAVKVDAAAAASRESTGSWEGAIAIYERGRTQFLKNAQAMGLTAAEARHLADQILQIPDKEARVKMDRADALAGLDSVIAKIKSTPGAKSVTVKTLSQSAIAALEGVGYKVRKLPDGRLTVTAATGSAIGNIGAVQGARDNLSDKSITITTRRVTVFDTLHNAPQTTADALRRQAAAARSRARGLASGGPVYGPGTSTSDSVLIAASDGEYMIRASSVDKYGLPFLDALNEGRLPEAPAGYASGGRVSGRNNKKRAPTKAQKAAAERARIKIKLEAAANLKEVAKDLGKALLAGMLGSRDKIRTTAKDLIKDIQKAAKGRKESDLVRMVGRETKELLELASKRDAVAARIKRAKEFAGTTSATAKRDASLGNLFDGDDKISAKGIHQRLQARLTKMKSFAGYIRTLAKRGLNKTMLREILGMGPEEGYAYASALVGANSTLFREINRTESRIATEADALGRTGADYLYDAGKNAGKGYLRGLSDQQKAIEAQMVKIAKGMERAIKKALGIKSPSTVMARLGVFTTEGLARGMVDGVPVLDRALGVVSGRVAETRPVLGRPVLTGAGAGGQPVQQIQIDVHGAMDPVAVGREIQRVVLRLKRDYGMNVQLGVS
ncbi:hypothetical protein [Streptomyces uncialis]|uniref:hypothetical protein n=1 Tax=Streptomyces uncialis TaxID=1048205 RepID=UPI00386D1011|nr:hypothetical protein OG924_12610 [Streptomyces uncialis]